MQQYRVAVIGFAHVHAPGMMEAFARHPRAVLTACADLPPLTPSLSMETGTRGSNLQMARDHYGMRVYESAQALLETEPVNSSLLRRERPPRICRGAGRPPWLPPGL